MICPQCKSSSAFLTEKEDALICLDCGLRLDLPDYNEIELQIELAYLKDQIANLHVQPSSMITREVEQLHGEVNFLQDKLDKHLDKSKWKKRNVL